MRFTTAVVVTLTALNLLNYIDRFVLPSVLAQMQKPGAIFAGYSEADLGKLNLYFLFVYMAVSPIAGILSSRVPRKWLVFGGVAIWSLATAATGLAHSYDQVKIARTLVGFGEAGYATVAPAMITDLYSPDRRARMLSVFYLAIPVGSALGFVLGGNIGAAFGWRAAFFVAGGPGLVFAIIALILPEPPRGRGATMQATPLKDALRSLWRNGPFIYTVIGGALMTFSLGAAAYWIPKYLEQVRGMKQAAAGSSFGGSVVVAGIIGTAIGGFLGDRWIRRDQGAYFVISGLGLIGAAPMLLISPYMATTTLVLLTGFVAQIMIFVNTGPLNAAIMDATPPSIRETAMGVNILFIHLLGDAVSPYLIGELVDKQVAAGVGRQAAWNLALATLAIPILLGGLALIIGARSARKATRIA